MKTKDLVPAAYLLIFLTIAVPAQTGGNFTITQSVLAGGGGSGTGGIFSLDYTLGQAVAGNIASGAPYDITPGFWPDTSPVSTPTPSIAITGTVTYGNAASGSPPPRFVSNVLISASGSPTVSTFTGAPGANAGQYALSGFGSGAYTVTPSKAGGVNSISSFDAARIAQHVAGINNLTATQLIVADVSNNGAVSSFDAAQIARYVTASPPFGTTGTWKFNPANRTYATVNANITGEDYTALLMGEVSGNWTNTGARPLTSGNKSTSVAAPHLMTPTNKEVTIPVAVTDTANKGIISYEFDLRYDPSVIQPRPDPIDLAGTVSSRLSAVANAEEAGILRVAVYGSAPIDCNGILLNLRFQALGAAGMVSPLTWERLMFNEGDPGTTATDGDVEIAASSTNQAEISGRLLNSIGDVISNARVTLTDSTNQKRSMVSNEFGIYHFGGLQAGQTYTIAVVSRGLTFTPLTVSVTGQLVSVDLIAN